MQEETADKLIHSEPHGPGAIMMPIILPLKRDLAILHGLQTLVADGHPMRIAGQIGKHGFRSTKWWLGVDHPFAILQRL